VSTWLPPGLLLELVDVELDDGRESLVSLFVRACASQRLKSHTLDVVDIHYAISTTKKRTYTTTRSSWETRNITAIKRDGHRDHVGSRLRSELCRWRRGAGVAAATAAATTEVAATLRLLESHLNVVVVVVVLHIRNAAREHRSLAREMCGGEYLVVAAKVIVLVEKPVCCTCVHVLE